MNAEEIVSRLLYRDALMLVIDKPAGLPVHPGLRGGETLHRYLDHLRFGLPRRPEVAHRLDRDTAGCLVLGRHAKALARIGELFRQGDVEKLYWAIVEGVPVEDAGVIADPIAPVSRTRSWRMKVDPNGQMALTHWRVLGRGEGLSWLELAPVTGRRTHQLRVHMAARGWPILGDPIYGNASPSDGPRLQLLARRITVPLYPKKSPISVKAPVPDHMADSIARCGAA
jgi:tRNA pseudouridine32 synthase/23S rRNA pseudouridine746 synthase